MTCQEYKELAASHALGALEADENAACDRHLAEPAHDGCLEAFEEGRAAVDLLPLALPPVKPAPELWQRIAAEIAAPAGGATVTPLRPRRGAPWWLTAVGWAAAGVAAAGLLHFRTRGGAATTRAEVAEKRVLATTERIDGCTRELDAARRESAAQAEAIALLELPATRVVAMAPQGGVKQRATAIVNLDEGRAVVVGRGLLPQADKDYELWVIRGDRKIPAGLLHAGEDGYLTMVIEKNLLREGVDAFAITLEPAGGGPEPRGPILLVGKV